MIGGSVFGLSKGTWAVALGETVFRDSEYYLIDRKWNLYDFCSTSWFPTCKLLLRRHYVSE